MKGGNYYSDSGPTGMRGNRPFLFVAQKPGLIFHFGFGDT